MNRDEYNELFHKVGLNRVAFKAVNDCDDEILTLVNEVIAAEREACADIAENWRCNGMPRTVLADQIRARGQS
jgi:hypothetical protein